MESLLLFLLLSVLTVGAINGFITMIKCSGWKTTLLVTALLWALLMFDLSIDAGLPGLFAASLLIGAIAGFLLLIKKMGLAITLVVTVLVFICCMVTVTVIASSL